VTELVAGGRVGKWTLVAPSTYTSRGGHKFSAWRCRCECGTEKVLTTSKLTSRRSLCCKRCSRAQSRIGGLSVTIVNRTSMSNHLPQQVCRECNRTVYLATIDGRQIAIDPDLISVVPLGQMVRLQARRLHSEMCVRYKSQAERIKALASAKRNKL
jgi:hypothetical protein